MDAHTARSSYSHRGSYYTLDENAHFDENGLWSFGSIWFSRQGTLLNTAEANVEKSTSGYFAEELEHLLHVATKEPLLRLVQQERIRHHAGTKKALGTEVDVTVFRKLRQLAYLCAA
jgi:hypothetical protein